MRDINPRMMKEFKENKASSIAKEDTRERQRSCTS